MFKICKVSKSDTPGEVMHSCIIVFSRKNWYRETWIQGRNGGGKGGTIPWMPNHCRGRQMTAGGAEKFQQCHMYILQYSKSASEDLGFEHGGAKLASCPVAI